MDMDIEKIVRTKKIKKQVVIPAAKPNMLTAE